MRYYLVIEYDGSGYFGWQRQKNGDSIQGSIEKAIFLATGEAVIVYGSGRTDSGVHALGQVAHFDLVRKWIPNKLFRALNAHLKIAGDSISILELRLIDQQFHARFSAIRRSYLYRIIARGAPLSLEKGRAWWISKYLDCEMMSLASNYLIGRHDFTTFRSVHCQALSPIRTIEKIDINQYGNIIEIIVVARSFLHTQIRSFVGSLKLVGEGKWTPDDLKYALQAQDRKACGPLSPPEGLYFYSSEYPELKYTT
ncbi:MAG: tRNA pseudouridine(38-40) synthase TruA [Candidatus Liberibacter europaeus]|uniref:tRNA pseudouridine synthase A n=1 Tax=Candidatus Liberibacter europaeus TaxID=744859 RepID=A0A2T4VXG3_9HYPH|nr:tRNA pseudouridine(38-40) synthase TruA [Candidatus Liberibacter europaeus]PTL86464.1 MAG: tRNA pseudouridine(38-40) synthase TruA [Candidatus Liberibacter europaeus]